MDWYNTDEAKANIDWVLAEIKERKRAEAAAELMQIVEQNREHVADEMYDQLQELSQNKKIPLAQYRKLKEELLQEIANLEFAK